MIFIWEKFPLFQKQVIMIYNLINLSGVWKPRLVGRPAIIYNFTINYIDFFKPYISTIFKMGLSSFVMEEELGWMQIMKFDVW